MFGIILLSKNESKAEKNNAAITVQWLSKASKDFRNAKLASFRPLL